MYIIVAIQRSIVSISLISYYYIVGLVLWLNLDHIMYLCSVLLFFTLHLTALSLRMRVHETYCACTYVSEKRKVIEQKGVNKTLFFLSSLILSSLSKWLSNYDSKVVSASATPD